MEEVPPTQFIPPRLSSTGFRHFYTPRPLDSPELSIRGIGIRELMPPSTFERPTGLGDYLFMLFHDPAHAAAQPVDPTASALQLPESLILWPPGAGQYYGNPQARFAHSWIHCEGCRIERLLAELPEPLPLRKAFALPDPAKFQQTLFVIHQELVASPRPDAVIVGNLLENCLREIARSLGAQPSGGADGIPAKLMAVRAHLGSHSAEPLTLPDLARMAGMSVPYFCAKFKAAFQTTPVECLIQHRMLHAAHLLADQGASIQEIAQRVGYEDAFHFSKMFRKHFGQSPRGFRKAQAQGHA